MVIKPDAVQAGKADEIVEQVRCADMTTFCVCQLVVSNWWYNQHRNKLRAWVATGN